MKKRAIISLTDKTGVEEFARGLSDLGYEILSTGGNLQGHPRGGHPGHSGFGRHRLPGVS